MLMMILAMTFQVVLTAADVDLSQDDPVMNKLRTFHMDVDFEDESLKEVIQHFRDMTDLNFVIEKKVEDPDELKVTLKLKNVRAISALRAVLNRLDLGAVLREGIVFITTKEELQKSVVTRVYDVRDLFVKIRDFPGPRIDLRPGSGAGGGDVEIVFTMEEAPAPGLDQEMLLEIIQNTTGGESWDENPYAKLQLSPSKLLIVTQSRAVHRRIEKLLKMLRYFK